MKMVNALVLSATLGVAGGVTAAQQTPVETVSLDISARPMSDALNEFARQSGLQVVFYTEIGQGITSPQLEGNFTAEEALRRLLTDTQLKYQFINGHTVTIRGNEEVSQSADGKEDLRVVQTDAPSTSQAEGQGEDQKSPQSASASKEADAGKISEIIVTATKRKESLQDVPISITAITGETLDRTGATGAEEYLASVPGVTYSAQGRGRSPIVIRGVSTEGSNWTNAQATTETYIDELATTNRWGGFSNPDLNIFDIERVEVLRGPQGTLFGSGSLGGTVRVITNKPNLSKFEARLQAGAEVTDGGDPGHSTEGMVNLPFANGAAALRAVAYGREDGGWVDNVRRAESDVNSGKTVGGRVMLGVEPTERLSIRLTATYEDAEVDDWPRAFFPGAGGTYDWASSQASRRDSELLIGNGVIEYDFGSFDFLSSTTYARRDSYEIFGLADLLAPFFASAGFDPADAVEYITHDTETIAQDVRFTSRGDGPFLWTIGAFYFNQRIDMQQFWDFGQPTGPSVNYFIDADTVEAALYGELTYELTDRFSVTGGARWFDNSFTVSRTGFGGGAFLPPTETEARELNPKISASYRFTPNVHLYASASQGYRIGQTNFNAGIDPNIPIGYLPDTLWNYEIGLKSTLFDGRLRANLTLYQIDWTDIQLTRFITQTTGIPTNITDNAGDAEIDGLEVELTAHPTDNLEIGSAISFVNAELVSVLPGVPFVVGSTLPGSADVSASTHIQYTTELGGGTSAYLRLGHHYVGEVWSNINNIPLYHVDPYNVFNARAGVYFSNYEVALYVENLTNADDVTSADANANAVPYVFRLQPRTIGVTFRARF